MSEVEIVCISKDNGNHSNPHEGITDFGWKNPLTGATGKSTKAQILDYLDMGNNVYVVSPEGKKAYCDTRVSSANNRFIQTYADGLYTNNLLSLNECPIKFNTLTI